MKIQSTSYKGNFKLFDSNESEISELIYKNWFSQKANAFVNGSEIKVSPKNIWKSKFDITRNNQCIGNIVLNWKGNVSIQLQGKGYTLKASGFLSFVFELVDGEKNKLLKMKPSFSWKKQNYNYVIDLFEKTVSDEMLELIVLCGFGANLYMTQMMAG